MKLIEKESILQPGLINIGSGSFVWAIILQGNGWPAKNGVVVQI